MSGIFKMKGIFIRFCRNVIRALCGIPIAREIGRSVGGRLRLVIGEGHGTSTPRTTPTSG